MEDPQGPVRAPRLYSGAPREAVGPEGWTAITGHCCGHSSLVWPRGHLPCRGFFCFSPHSGVHLMFRANSCPCGGGRGEMRTLCLGSLVCDGSRSR